MKNFKNLNESVGGKRDDIIVVYSTTVRKTLVVNVRT